MQRKITAALVFLATMFLFAACAQAKTAENIVEECKFKVSGGDSELITDSSMKTCWVPEKGEAEIMIRLPEKKATYIQINWLNAPENYMLREYDDDQAVLYEHGSEDDTFACIADLHEIVEGTRYIQITFDQDEQGVNKIRIFGEGELPNTVVKWEPPLEKAGLMVISTHMDDEWLWFGGIIPYYGVVEKKDLQVVYMADCGRLRYAEALNALAVAGVRTYPIFMGLIDKKADSLSLALDDWGGKEQYLDVMTTLVRRLRPEVILTHDWNGEYGHVQHKLTSRSMETVIEQAADETCYPESAAKYGAWQVKKLYRHLETKDQIAFNWDIPYEALGGRTPFETAVDAMNENASQLHKYRVESHGQYDNTLFGLSWSAVGNDVLHQDLFENIADIKEPEATPVPVPTEAPTPIATPEITFPETQVPEEKDGAPVALIVIAAAAALAAAVYLTVIRKRVAEAGRRRRKRKPLAGKRTPAKKRLPRR